MTDLDLTKLREIAVAATPGPWNLHTLRTDETHDIRGSIDDEANIVIYAECEDADAHHIATFDPPTVLAMMDEIERLRAKNIQLGLQASTAEHDRKLAYRAMDSANAKAGSLAEQVRTHYCPDRQTDSEEAHSTLAGFRESHRHDASGWKCPSCGSKESVGYGMWPNSGPVKAQCVPCGAVSDWPEKDGGNE